MLYCTYQDALNRGFTSDEETFNMLAEIASSFIESITGNIFYPLSTTLEHNGLDLPFLPVKYSIIEITEVNIRYIDTDVVVDDFESALSTTNKTVNLTQLTVYNGQNPSNDYWPRIAFINQQLKFPEGYNNVIIEGIFGCVVPNPDFDPNQPPSPTNPQYLTPPPIKKACLHLVLLNEFPPNDPRHLIIRRGNYLTEEVTDYHRYKLSDNIAPSIDSLTGDNVVDNILDLYTFKSKVRIV